MRTTHENTRMLPFEIGLRNGVTEYLHEGARYLGIVFLNLCIFAAIFYHPAPADADTPKFLPQLLPVGFAVIGLFFCFLRDRQIKAPRLYVAFVAASGAAQLMCWTLWPAQYSSMVWINDSIENMLLCLISVEIFCALFPDRYIKAYWIMFIVIFGGAFIVQSESLNLSSTASFSGIGALLLFMLTKSITWTKESMIVTGGLIITLLGNLAPILWMTLFNGGEQPVWLHHAMSSIGIIFMSGVGLPEDHIFEDIVRSLQKEAGSLGSI